MRWYQWDPSKWVIKLLSWIGLTSDLKTVSRFSILQAKLAADSQLFSEKLKSMSHHPLHPKIGEIVQAKYAHLLGALKAWEVSKIAHQKLLLRQMSERSDELVQSALRNLEHARLQFNHHHRQWLFWARLAPGDLVAIAA